jgi:hypothetical protein
VRRVQGGGQSDARVSETAARVRRKLQCVFVALQKRLSTAAACAACSRCSLFCRLALGEWGAKVSANIVSASECGAASSCHTRTGHDTRHGKHVRGLRWQGCVGRRQAVMAAAAACGCGCTTRRAAAVEAVLDDALV